MLKFDFLGTCSGTEPFENMHHCSWVLESGGKNYWFDAGENCAHRAYCDGVKVMNTAALFVSHPDIDHVGGFANLLALFNKLIERNKQSLVCNNTLKVFFPDLEFLKTLEKVVTWNGKRTLKFEIDRNSISDGELFCDENVRVSALHNTHLHENGENGYHSYSFLIESDGKRIVFSGDVCYPAELDSLIGDGCDMLIMETGHHSVQEVIAYAKAKNAKRLRFIHHGRQIIENRAECEQICKDSGMDAVICYDGMTEKI